MPHIVPTVDQFRVKFPTFATVGDATITAALLEASDTVNIDWVERDYQPAILYLAAHILTLDGALTASSDISDAGSIINAGLVSEMKVGDVSVKLAGASGGTGGGSGASGSGYASTGYGRRFLELLRRNFPAVAIV